MSTMASQITGAMIVYSTVCPGTDQRKHQSSASLAFVRGIHWWLINSLHKGPIMQKMFPFDDVIMWRQKTSTGGSILNLSCVPSNCWIYNRFKECNILSEDFQTPSSIAQSVCQQAFSLLEIGFQRPSGFESCIQQRKTTCLLSIRKSLACARASKLTTTNTCKTVGCMKFLLNRVPISTAVLNLGMDE